jgi:hypothetical protein
MRWSWQLRRATHQQFFNDTATTEIYTNIPSFATLFPNIMTSSDFFAWLAIWSLSANLKGNDTRV